MTLRKLVKRCCPKEDIPLPVCFANLKVVNYENFCFYRLGKYFTSYKFKYDLDLCLIELDDVTSRRSKPYFALGEEISRNIIISLIGQNDCN